VSTKRLWAIAGGAVALVVIIVLVVIAVAPKASEALPENTPTATSTPTAIPSPTASATPTPTFTTPATVAATCENTSTDVFRSMMTTNGWVSWQTQDQQIGARPFDTFPNGSPAGAIVCRWGADPELATDNVIDLAWSPIDPESAVAAMDELEEQGLVRIDAPEGIYLAMTGPEGFTDAEGYGETYLFGFDDVRWAATKADVTAYVKAPGEAG
jgi:hypothetical protein